LYYKGVQIYASPPPRKSREFDPQLLGNAGRLLIGELRANRVFNLHKDWPPIGRAQRYDLVLCTFDTWNHGTQGGAIADFLTQVYLQLGNDQTDVGEDA
jgi:hypothetical protein